MDWFLKLLIEPSSIAHIVLLYALVICTGVALGRVKIGGIALGSTFVLFVGILAGHLFKAATGITYAAPIETMEFIKEFGLILFVYCIGLQVGPGFFTSLRHGGLSMNLMAVALVLCNVGVMLALYFLVFPQSAENLAMMVGVMYGAVTNTPGLGAATGVLPSLPAFQGAGGSLPPIGSGYACAYPLGVVGIIGATIAIRYLCRVSLDGEQQKIRAEQENNPHAMPKHITVRVTNRPVIGRTLQELGKFLQRQFVCTRVLTADGQFFVPHADTRLQPDMKLYVVCSEADADDLTALIGEATECDWSKSEDKAQHYISRRLVVTKPEIQGKTFGQIHFSTLYGVNVTRLTRSGMELFANRNLRLQLGDRLQVTGTEEAVNRVTEVIGNSVRRLDHPSLGSIFFGIMLGILLGMIPIALPGVSVPVKLGLAGGPLVVAILIGAFGYRFKITAYTTTSANLMLREVGLVLFLASVGIEAGSTFWDTVARGDGITYVWTGFLITVLPILIVGLYARLKKKMNYFTLMGFIAGSYTDPPALAFANQTAGNDAPAVGYSTVYPLTMFMRILVAQLVLLLFC